MDFFSENLPGNEGLEMKDCVALALANSEC